MKREALARMIDHTLLKPEATPDQVSHLCAEAREHHFATVCINPRYVPLAAAELAGTGTAAVCNVVGFPWGASATATKVANHNAGHHAGCP
jgi:deoxyribose-phosphate aldolase